MEDNMSRFILHTKTGKKEYLKYLAAGIACIVLVVMAGYAIHNIGTARAKSRELVLLHTEEEFAQYLLDTESEEYNLNGRYQLEEDLDLSWLEYSIGTNIEPFTGSFDGNGHVISGLVRPLFGVMEHAEVEHLFLSGAEIVHPFTYYDGERYVDGYGALAAYAVDSSIRNCGMEGAIHTASPTEAEYQIGKASPADAEELKGPGVLETTDAEAGKEESTGVSGEIPEGMETSAQGPGNSGDPGNSGESGNSGKPGNSGELGNSGEPGDNGEPGSNGEPGNNGGPGVETTDAESLDSTLEGEGNQEGTIPQESTAADSSRPGGSDTGITESETLETKPSEPSVETSGAESSSSDSASESETSGIRPSEARPSEPEMGTPDADRPAPGTSETGQSTPGAGAGGTEAGTSGTETPTSGTGTSKSGIGTSTSGIGTSKSGIGTSTSGTGTSGAGTGNPGTDASGRKVADSSDVNALSETAGYIPLTRQNLKLKVSTVIDTDALEMASPSDAEEDKPDETTGDIPGPDQGEEMPSDREDTQIPDKPEESMDGPEEYMDDPEEYINGPEGDIYILVVAERITAGGLVAEVAGDTQISDSFTLVVISSDSDDTDSYTGGMAGIIGTTGRIENSYAAGSMETAGTAGGFAALHEGFIQNCYSTMIISGNADTCEAFTAAGGGILDGCVYDSQMACVDSGTINEGNNNQEPKIDRPSEPDNDTEIAGVLDTDRTTDTIPSEEDHTGMKQIGPGEWVETEASVEENEVQQNDELQTSSQDVQQDTTPNTQSVTEQDTQENAQQSVPKNSQEFAHPFSLKGLNTSEMSGFETQIPGNWYLTEGAYPQLEFFASSENELISSSSRASVIALKLPEGTTLVDIFKDGDIILPSEVDGQEIEWEAEGGVTIDANSQVTVRESAASIRHEVPEVGSALETLPESEVSENPEEETTASERSEEESEISESPEENRAEEETAMPESEEPTSAAPSSQPSEENKAESTGNVKLKASVGGVSRSFALMAVEPREAAFNNWQDVGADVEAGGTVTGVGKPVLNSDGFYEIENEEQFGWVAYQVNALGNLKIKVKLMRDLNLFGSKYTLYTGEQNLENIENALQWVCIGTASKPFGGTIDGNWHEIDGLHMKAASDCGLVGRAKGSAVINRLGIGFNSAIKGTAWTYGSAMFVGLVDASVANSLSMSDCYNLGTVEATGNYTAGFIGDDNGGAYVGIVKNCYNAGSSPRFAAAGQITYVNCYADITRNPGNADGIGNPTRLTTSQMQSWGAAYALNEKSMEGGWKYTEGEYPGFGTLDPAPSWGAVAQGVKDGFVTATEASTNSSGAYEIDTAEKLALFAYDVNAGTKTTASASLITNIDLMGRKYGGTADAPIRWTPIGTADHLYQGTFMGPSVIANMRVEQAGVGGLFGYVGSGTMLYALGLDTSCSITTTAPAAGGDSGTAAMVGIVKNANESSALGILMCYSRASVSGHNSHTGAFVGQAMGTLDSSTVNVISNSYAAGTLSTSSGTVGALAGNLSVGDSKGSIVCSYWDQQTSSVSSLNAVSQGTPMLSEVGAKSTTEMKSDAFLSLLNKGGVSWIRSDDRNNGYPSFSTAPAVYTSWEDVGQAAPAPSSRYPSSSITPGTAGNPYLIKNAEDLAWFAYQVNNVADRNNLCGELRNDINLYGSFYNGENAYDPNDSSSATLDKALRWVPIGSDADGKRYTGTFNGNGHTITAMLAKDAENQGLFGTLGSNAAVKKTSISDSRIEVTGYHAGGIAGYVNGTGITITECGNKGSLTGKGVYFGGCVGGADSTAEVTLEGCYNEEGSTVSNSAGDYTGGILGGGRNTSSESCRVTIRNCINRGTVSGVSGVGGIIGRGTQVTVTGCYHAGHVTASGSGVVGSIAGYGDVEGAPISDCLIEKPYASGTSVNGVLVETKGMGTWGAAWRLNGGSLKQTTGFTWTYVEGSSYPVLNTTELAPAESWEPVGEALEYGLLKDMTKPTGNGNASPYQIQTAEQLAWFAWKVNVEKISASYQNIELKKDINLFGEKYSGYTGEKNLANIEKALKWTPIGGDTNPYQGTFHGGRHEIDGMYLNGYRYFALVGAAQYPAKVIELGMGANSKVITNGDFCGLFIGGIIITNNPVEVTSCYNLGTVVSTGSGTYNAAFVGDDVGKTSSSNSAIVSNCYNAGDTVGFAKVSNGTIENCYADTTLNSRNAVMEKKYGSGVTSRTTAEMKTSEVAASLNTYNGTLKTGTDRVWYTSLDTEKTKGYPTFQAPVTVKVPFTPDTMGADGKVETLPGSLSIPAMKLRAIGLTDENFTPGRVPASDNEFQLVAEGSIKGTNSGYSSYGYTNANKNVAVKAGAVDLQPVVSAASLNNPVTSLGTVDKVTLNIAAAYTRGTQRNLLLEGTSGNDRYEICIAIAGVTSKSLEVDLPLSVAMADELIPDGTEKTAYSVDTAIQNSQNYPMEGKILKAVPISKTDRTGYQALKPIARDAGYGSGQIYNAGVKLGITNPKTGTGVISGNLYYNPDTPDTNPWMKYQLKAAGGTLPYRYLVKYKADPYYDSEHPNFGYTISYQFGVMADDYSAAAGAVAGQ